MKQKVLLIGEIDSEIRSLDFLYGLFTDILNVPSINEAIKLSIKPEPDLIICCIDNDVLNSGRLGDLKMVFSSTKFIFICADLEASLFDKALELEPVEILIKPINQIQLEASIKVAVNNTQFNYKGHNGVLDRLSNTEIKIIELISCQKTSKQIAEVLFISEKTVRNHRYNICKKLKLIAKNNSLNHWVAKNIKK